MYIKLIQPRMLMRPMDTHLKIRMSPPLGLLTIANIIRRMPGGHRVVIENENIRPIVWDEPDLVGITVTVDALPRAMEIAEGFRAKGAVTVAGGIHITTAMEHVPDGAFDILCVGAAEGTWENIVRDVEAGCHKPVYRCRRDLSGGDIVSPAYDILDRSDYLYCNIVHTSRGCPFRCDFCYNSSKERRYVNRRVEDVIADIRATGSRHIMFIDDNFAGNPKWTRELLRELKPMGIRWNAAVSVNAADDPELLDEMRDAGCGSLFIGFESINGDCVGGVHKVQNDPARYETAIKAIHDRGIMINASFVFGIDGDTPRTFRDTVDFIVRNRIETVTSHILTPYPGTVTFDKMKAEGRLVTEDLSLYNTAHVVFRPTDMTPEELYEGYLWVYKEVYSFKNILRRMPRDPRVVPSYLMFNLFYRKFGRFTDWVCRLITYERLGKIAERLAGY